MKDLPGDHQETITLEVREIPDLHGYFITADGEIYRKRMPIKHPDRYLMAYASQLDEKRGKRRRQNIGVHRLVAKAWVGPAPFDGAVVRHRDGDSLHNHFTNLKWGTQAENIADAIEHGTFACGEKQYKAKLTEDNVREIKRRLRDQPQSFRSLGKEFGVHAATISSIARGNNWRHVQ